MFKSIMEKIRMGSEELPVPVISPSQANAKTIRGDLVLIDVREPHEWAVDGTPAGSRCVALQSVNFIDDVTLLVDDDKAASIAVCCRSGMRGKKAAKLLQDAGFTDVVNVEGGMMRWVSEKLPVS